MALKNIGAYFIQNQKFVDASAPGNSVTATVTSHKVGQLSLPSGKVVVCDPTAYTGMYTKDAVRQKALAKTLPPGTYPVIIATATVQFAGKEPEKSQPVVAAMLRLRDEPATSWVIAGLPGEEAKIAALDPEKGEIIGYRVEGGMSCFFDESYKPFIVEQGEALLDDIEGQLQANKTHASVANPQGETVLIAFPSGYGDGLYPVYLGLDAQGDVVALVTDFDILFNAELV